MSYFLRNRKQRVALNGETSYWDDVNVEVPQGLILGLLVLLIYINDIAYDLPSNAKLFVDDTALFSVVHNSNTTAKELKNDLVQINKLTYQWKMIFNPALNKTSSASNI